MPVTCGLWERDLKRKNNNNNKGVRTPFLHRYIYKIYIVEAAAVLAIYMTIAEEWISAAGRHPEKYIKGVFALCTPA